MQAVRTASGVRPMEWKPVWKPIMIARSCSVTFRDHIEFFEAIHETGRPVNISDADGPEGGLVSLSAPFAEILLENHSLFHGANLNVLEISPRADIVIPYDFDGGVLGMDYLVDGSYLLDESSGRTVLPRDLFLLPPSGCRGSMVFRGGISSKTVAFGGPGRILSDLLGEDGGELWAEALKADGEYGRGPHLLRAPQYVAGSFLQMLDCDYPTRAKRLFLEGKLMEILSRIIARGLPAEENGGNGGDAFELERIRMIPGILMERINNPPSISELAHELSVNSTTMKKGFKNIFGEPIYAHHRNLCLSQAATLLLETDKSVFEIASNVGYSNSGNFGSAFKRRYGVSPIRYRRNGRSALPLQEP